MSSFGHWEGWSGTRGGAIDGERDGGRGDQHMKHFRTDRNLNYHIQREAQYETMSHLKG